MVDWSVKRQCALGVGIPFLPLHHLPPAQQKEGERMTNDLTAKRGFVGKVVVWLLLTLAAVLLALVVMSSKPQPAQAAGNGTGNCGQPEQGYWVNKGTVDFVQSIYLTCYITGYTDQGAAIHTWTAEVWVLESRSYGYSCSSGEYWCTVHWWPKTAAGYTTTTGAIYVNYNHPLWTDTLYANMSKYQPGLLWVGVDRVGKGYQQGAEDSTQDLLTRP